MRYVPAGLVAAGLRYCPAVADAPDPDRLRQYAFTLFTNWGAVTSGMVYLGDRLGLYRAMADAAAPLTTGELAGRAGLDERWVRWRYNQAAATLVDIDADERVSLSPEAVTMLAEGPRRRRRSASASSPASRRSWPCSRSSRPRSGPVSAMTSTATGRTARPASSRPWRERTGTTSSRWGCRLSTVSWRASSRVVWRPTSSCYGAGIAVCLMAEAYPAQPGPWLRHLTPGAGPRQRRRQDLGLANAHFHDARA